MAFDWKEYLNLARILHEEENTKPLSKEAAARCGVSCAYFAAFCSARNYARDHLDFEPLGEAEDHGKLRHFLYRQAKFRRTAARLDELRKWRNQCDYDDELSADLDRLLTSAIEAAQKVVDSLA